MILVKKKFVFIKMKRILFETMVQFFATHAKMAEFALLTINGLSGNPTKKLVIWESPQKEYIELLRWDFLVSHQPKNMLLTM